MQRYREYCKINYIVKSNKGQKDIIVNQTCNFFFGHFK